MVKHAVVEAKLALLADRVDQVRLHRVASRDALAGDRVARDLVAFNLMLAVQACTEIASHVIADEGLRAATTLAEAFARLGEHGVLTPATVKALSSAVGLRNVIAHGYAGIDLGMLQSAATAGVDDLDRFAAEIARWLAAQGA